AAWRRSRRAKARSDRAGRAPRVTDHGSDGGSSMMTFGSAGTTETLGSDVVISIDGISSSLGNGPRALSLSLPMRRVGGSGGDGDASEKTSAASGGGITEGRLGNGRGEGRDDGSGGGGSEGGS